MDKELRDLVVEKIYGEIQIEGITDLKNARQVLSRALRLLAIFMKQCDDANKKYPVFDVECGIKIAQLESKEKVE